MNLKTLLSYRLPTWLQTPSYLVGILFICWMGILHLETSNILYSTQESKIAAERIQTKNDREILDLATEFGYDPLIVAVVRQESTVAFRQRACDCPTWRFVKSDKELTYLLLSIIQIESRGDVRAVNPAGPAYGLTQLLMSTARDYDDRVNQQQLLTIPKNLHIAVLHFVDLLEHFHGNYTLAIIAWNKGANGVDRSIALGESPDNGYARTVFYQALTRNAQ